MASFSGIHLEQLIHTSFTCSSTTELDFVFDELASIGCYNMLWYEIVYRCLSSYHHNDAIQYIWNHCEDFEELDNKKKKKILGSIIKYIQNSVKGINYCELFKTQYMNIHKMVTMSKRKQTTLWKTLNRPEYLNDIYEYYSSINNEKIKLACFAICYCKHKGQ